MLPLLFGLFLLIVQVGLVVRDQVLVVHAAREAARVAAIDGDAARAIDAGRSATALVAGRLEIVVHPGGDRVTATVRYRSPVVVPLLRRVRAEVPLSASVTMHDEGA